MEPPLKRARIGPFVPVDDDADDELFLDPAEVNAQRDPAVILEQSRAVASFKLKSRWEDVFKKYERDFTDEGDIINFYKNVVEVDNGHIESLEDVDDSRSVAASESADLDEEERILHGAGTASGQLVRNGPRALMSRPFFGGRLSGLGSFVAAPPRLSTVFSSGLQYPSYSPFGALSSLTDTAESMWKAPELPAEAFNHEPIVTVITRKIPFKALAAAGNDGSEDEDDILMGDTTTANRDQQVEEPSDAAPQQSSTAVDEHVLGQKATVQPAHPADAVLGSQEVTTPSSRKKTARRIQRRLDIKSAEADGPPKEAGFNAASPSTPLTSHTNLTSVTEPCGSTQLPVSGQDATGKFTKRRHGRSKRGVLEPSQERNVPEQATHELSTVTIARPDSREETSEPKLRRRGRSWKHRVTEATVQDAVRPGRQNVDIVPDTDGEPPHSSLAILDGTDPDHSSDKAAPDVRPSVHPPARIVNIEVRLLRRRRMEVVGAEELSDQSQQPSMWPTKLANGSPNLRPAGCEVRKKPKKALGASLKSGDSTPSRAKADDSTRANSTPARSVESETPATSTPSKSQRKGRLTKPGEGGLGSNAHEQPLTVEQLDQPGHKFPKQPQSPTVPAKIPAAPVERFSRNTIDEAYAFSDDEEAWVPARVKKTALKTKHAQSTTRMSSAKRPAKGLMNPASSPSIREAFHAVRKSFRTTRSKANEDHVSAAVDASHGVIHTPQGSLTPGCEDLTLHEGIPVIIPTPVAHHAPGLDHPQQDETILDTISSPLHGLPSEIPESVQGDADFVGSPSLSVGNGHIIQSVPDTAEPFQLEHVPGTPTSREVKETRAPSACELVTPPSHHRKPVSTVRASAAQPSTSKRSILSLLSDSDEDELSLPLDQISPLVRGMRDHHPAELPIRSRNTAQKPSLKRLSLGSYGRGTPRLKESRLSASWRKSASATKVARRTGNVGDAGDVHRTPGGTLRRCGEDGFRCDRDFCFACL